MTAERRLLRLLYGPTTVDGGLWVDDTDAPDPTVWRYSATRDEVTKRPLSEEDPEAFAVHCALLKEADRG